MYTLILILLTVVLSRNAFAADAGDIYASVAIGAGVALIFFLVLVFYMLSKYLFTKVAPGSPSWSHKIAGGVGVILLFIIWGAVAG